MWNMCKINNNDVSDVVLTCKLWTDFTYYYGAVSTIDFKHVTSTRTELFRFPEAAVRGCSSK